MNVSLTRAKFVLIVIGNSDNLSVDKIWAEFILYCSNNKNYYQLDKEELVNSFLNNLFSGKVDLNDHLYKPKEWVGQRIEK